MFVTFCVREREGEGEEGKHAEEPPVFMQIEHFHGVRDPHPHQTTFRRPACVRSHACVSASVSAGTCQSFLTGSDDEL